MAVEREVKLGAWAGFELPDFGDDVAGLSIAPRPPRTLTAVYYDTADLRLARWGITIRHRSGNGSEWTVKLPEDDDGPALVRRELDFPGPASRMPTEATAVLRAYLRGTPLVPVARLKTVRSGVDVLDGEGARVAEIVDDEVSVIHGGRVAARFREVEVEIDERAPAELLGCLVARLRSAGAGSPDPTPKVIRALGPRALAPPEVEVHRIGRKATTADMVTQAVATSVVRILRHDPGVRLGDDPEDVHQARVGTRRLRSDLRTFSSVLDGVWVARLRQELQWLARLLGDVRDADVMDERLRRQVAALESQSAEGVAPLFRRLAVERDEARGALAVALDSPRYVTLLEDLVAAAREPRFDHGAHARGRKLIPDLVARPWTSLWKEVSRLPSRPSSDELHQVRIRAKRARYAAEAVAPVAGKKATSFARRLADLQTVLGDHHDAIVAESWLNAAAAATTTLDPPVQAAAAKLIAIQQAEARDRLKNWRRAWKAAKAEKRRARL